MDSIPIPEETFEPPKPLAHQYKMIFLRKDTDFFGIFVVNCLFTILTIGFYYPFARAKTIHYLYGETSLQGSRLYFSGTGTGTGTGREMFKGFIIAIAVFVSLNLLFYLSEYNHFYIGLLILYLGCLVLIPIAINGSTRYRMSRTIWHCIRFGYREKS